YFIKPLTAFWRTWVAREALAVACFALFSLPEKLTDGVFRLFFAPGKTHLWCWRCWRDHSEHHRCLNHSPRTTSFALVNVVFIYP
ncbi:hypothetical protein PQQ87_35510, partial [Paraburkholderia nemoris]|uniref:hypothetical protein n=1 Tax=Paraburkholderia nemoris TaxID=2793076 RepID=UPI0038B7C6BC